MPGGIETETIAIASQLAQLRTLSVVLCAPHHFLSSAWNQYPPPVPTPGPAKKIRNVTRLQPLLHLSQICQLFPPSFFVVPLCLYPPSLDSHTRIHVEEHFFFLI